MRQAATLAAVLAVMICGAGTVLAAPAGAGQGGAPMQANADQALLIIDIQNFYFEGGSVPLTGPVEAAKQARRVLDRFRERRLPVDSRPARAGVGAGDRAVRHPPGGRTAAG